MNQICSDLTWEQNTLDTLVSSLKPDDWAAVTLCDGWTVKDEICHLAYFDYTARLSAADPASFDQHLVEIQQKIKEMADFIEVSLAKGRAMVIEQLLQWWREERRKLIEALLRLDPHDRLSWYGPPMSASSFASARLMETWAHGQDIYDVLKKKRPVSPGLKHVAHLGVTTFGWSFSNRGMIVPDTPVFVTLTAPSGNLWTWGDETAVETITGSAEEFCLVVTQRRHVDDTALVCDGRTARQWMLNAQAFAGPPDNGPPAGTFR
ncbi:hypothetical protein DSCA_36920 [Desulfosarcina alkanivorans]|uniref:TIGR03084 family protein n=1 Tax=Desulfosarcina alkanivorans TaxID=571177 RepID=A0A5K7YJB1_9BACT|nr:TIGR03084 family metal-binding protein [Desulfosarcina alkanivorans]BBO69762.1 hypothetical protein DSCA_36920 [Desulfosarcina alkanivorans]